jgi:hypothetical protein
MKVLPSSQEPVATLCREEGPEAKHASDPSVLGTAMSGLLLATGQRPQLRSELLGERLDLLAVCTSGGSLLDAESPCCIGRSRSALQLRQI